MRRDLVISEWKSNFRKLQSNEAHPNTPSLTIGEIALPHLSFVDQHYRKYGQQTSEVSSIQRALKPLFEPRLDR